MSLSTNLRRTVASAAVLTAIHLGAAAASAAPAQSLARSIDVDAPPAQVWALIGNFCAIRDWHPMIATCSTDGKSPPTRSLLGKDGKTRFVEREMARDDVEHLYSYNFVATPLPAANYLATIRVVPRGNGASTVVWSGSYIPQDGKEKDVSDALANIYETGLSAVRARFAK